MSRFTASTYDISRPSGRCAFTDRELEPGETYYAALVELTEQEVAELPSDQRAAGILGLRRLDVSAEVWEQGRRPDNMFGFWRSTVAQPNEKKKLFVDDGILMNLLQRLADAEQPERIAFRYVLALILMRKKLLRYDGSERREVEADGRTVEQHLWRLTPKLDLAKGPLGKWNPDAAIDVIDPRLDESRMEEIAQQLGEILEAEL